MTTALAPSTAAPRASDARFAVVVLTSMNLLNYVDRYVPSAVKDQFKRDLHLTDRETSLPITAFVIVYMLASPLFGALSDRFRRTHLIAAGVALWSLATASAALATGFLTFLLARAFVGVGEAAYATLAPPLLSDFFPPEKRNRVLTYFFVAIPVGAAIGFGVGAIAGKLWGWRVAFMVCGLPGILAALLALRIRDPGSSTERTDSEPAVDWPSAFRTLVRTPSYVYAVAGYTAVTFAAGAMGDWLPTYLVRVRHIDLAHAGVWSGAATALGGLGGTLAGGLLADKLSNVTKNRYFALSGLSMIPASVLVGCAFLAPTAAISIVCIGLGQFFLWFYNGPINTVIADSASPALRARAFSLSILSIHLLGDAVSPTILGAISDATNSLATAVWIAPGAMAVGAAIWCLGWRRL